MSIVPRGKRIEEILIIIIMSIAPILVFILFLSISTLLLVCAIEFLAIIYLAIRKRAQNKLRTTHKEDREEVQRVVSHSPIIQSNITLNGGDSLQFPEPMLDMTTLDVLEGFNTLDIYQIFMNRNGRNESVMILVKNPNSMPEWVCGIMALKIERFTQSYTLDHLAALLDHLNGQNFSISYITDLDHAYIRVIRDRPIVKNFEAATMIVIKDLLENFILVYNAFKMEFPGCEITQICDSALRDHLFRKLFDFDPQTAIEEYKVRKKDMMTEIEYEKVELRSATTFMQSPQLKQQLNAIPKTSVLSAYDMMESDIDSDFVAGGR